MEAFEQITRGGATDFARLVEACEALGPYCLIGSLAVNCYVEPIYSLDAEFVVATDGPPRLAQLLQAPAPVGELRIRFTTQERYRSFPVRAIEADVLGARTKVASIEDLVRATLWSYEDLERPFSKRKKDELDLIRLAEVHPQVRSLYPRHVLEQLNRD